MIFLLTIFLNLIPISLTMMIFLSLSFLLILPHLPVRAVMLLTSVWLAWKLKLSAGGGWLQKRNVISLLP